MVTSVVTEIQVSKKGELRFFEVNIPEDVTLAFDPEATIRGSIIKDIRNIKGMNIAGIVKLQSENKADLEYYSVVRVGSSPLEILLPGYVDVVPDLLNLFADPYYENACRRVPSVDAIDSYTLYGCYEDVIGKEMNRDISYTISLCIWTKLKEPKNSKA